MLGHFLTSALIPFAVRTSAASSAVPTIFEKVTIETSVPFARAFKKKQRGHK